MKYMTEGDLLPGVWPYAQPLTSPYYSLAKCTFFQETPILRYNNGLSSKLSPSLLLSSRMPLAKLIRWREDEPQRGENEKIDENHTITDRKPATDTNVLQVKGALRHSYSKSGTRQRKRQRLRTPLLAIDLV
jgi:hypothetical protein